MNKEPLTLQEVNAANKKLNEPAGFQAYCREKFALPEVKNVKEPQ